ncbi:uncharacterized protein LOC129410907 isoform X2 [Boleophthalmus pectinirostris]|uniref:uncharacterized protein LOC129410907 isoform X2 n=1 Tax=Boleophthalmus pectinirostris TaxID=150288 RepID=UPI002430F772|nr:uncharacterized protein LOC129410907 isoform X2 [Boleophthalmus pectinirostris]
MDCLKVHRDISRLTWVKSLQSSVSGFFVDKEELKQRIVQLLLREDERSREQDSEEHLQKKKKDLISLFRDIEESGENWHNLYLTDNTPYNCTAIIISFCFRYKLL